MSDDHDYLLKLLEAHGRDFLGSLARPEPSQKKRKGDLLGFASPLKRGRLNTESDNEEDVQGEKEEWRGFSAAVGQGRGSMSGENFSESEEDSDGGIEDDGFTASVHDPGSSVKPGAAVVVFSETSFSQHTMLRPSKSQSRAFMSSKVSKLRADIKETASAKLGNDDDDAAEEDRTSAQNDAELRRLVHTQLLSASLNPELNLSSAHRKKALAGRVLELAGGAKLGSGEKMVRSKERDKAAKRVREGIEEKQTERRVKQLEEAKDMGNYHPTIKKLFEESEGRRVNKRRERGIGTSVGKFRGGVLKLSQREIDAVNVSHMYWLMKAEPDSRVVKGKDVKFSVSDFEAAGTTPWEGVRNHQAKNYMKSMQMGDKVGPAKAITLASLELFGAIIDRASLSQVIFYHSNCKQPGVAGFAHVVKEAYPDYTAWDPAHPYYDPKTVEEKPTWFMVDVAFDARATHFVPLAVLRKIAAGGAEPTNNIAYIGPEGVVAVKGMELVTRGRLSVQKVEEGAYETIVKMAEMGGWDEEDEEGSKAGKKAQTPSPRSGLRSVLVFLHAIPLVLQLVAGDDADGSAGSAPTQSWPPEAPIMQRSPSPSTTTTTSFAPEENLVVIVPSDPKSTPSTSISPTNAPPVVQSPPQTIQFSDTTTPEDYGSIQDKSFVILDANASDEATDTSGHESVSLQEGGHETIIVMESGEGDGQWYTDGDNHELKRVKVYELQGSRWVDQGTAFCFGHYDEAASEAMLIARAESDYNNVILQTTIRPSDVYQRQQGELPRHTLPPHDPEGCAEVWNFILEVQRMHSVEEPSSPFAGPEPSVTTAQIIRSGHLPQPALGIIPEIDRAIKQLSRTASIKEKICEYIQRAEYLKAMIDVLHQAEDLESLENLHPLCVLMQTILMMNDHGMYEHILEDDIFMGVIGMLEYDPEFPNHKANYRQFMLESAHFRQPIPVHDPAVEKKIHHTHRLQFLKDVVLARALDDSTFNVLNSCIMFNQVDILCHVQNDERFMQDIFRLFLRDPPPEDNVVKMEVDQPEEKPKASSAPPPPSLPFSSVVSAVWSEEEPVELTQRRREVILLIQQLCIMGKNVQLPTRMQLFKMLVDRGVLHALHWAFTLPETSGESQQVIAVAGEVLMTLLDHDVNGVREQIVRQCDHFALTKATKDESLLSLLCGVMVKSKDLAVQTLVGDALRMMLELPSPESTDSIIPTKLFSRPKDDAKIEKFLDFFYKLCVHSLVKPIIDVPVYKQASVDWISHLTREKTNLYLSLCDLLSTFVLQHSFRSHFFMLTSAISSHVATLLLSKDKHLRLGALRYFRNHLKNNNRNFLNHLIKLDVFRPVLDLAAKEAQRDTLVSSCCLEFFDYMKKENIKDVIQHIMLTQETKVKELSESPLAGPYFKNLIDRWEKNTHPEKEEKPPPEPDSGRRVDMSEENYFHAEDDEEDEDEVPTPFRQPNRKRIPSIRGNGAARARTARPPMINLPRTPQIGTLVEEYGDDDEDADGEAEIGPQPDVLPPRPSSRLSKRSRNEDEDEDDVLDRLAGIRSKPQPFRPEKRRRENEGNGAGPGASAGAGEGTGAEVGNAGFVNGLVAKATKTLPAPAGVEGGGPKRIKLKLGGAIAAAVKATPPETRSEPSTKDGDTG
ncbi:component of IIS longevity pathway SMK-1-domain-containing protein [Vararia minispora EC-137]|uniref:Component of IIS longevity pathway SMK-1-domain-containing protein n=1 Tax=Vararia minispora EC-137 TaxID=1314806 RepID=A0ACB8QV27_9AGAM|nr:component of IIS longevity pathway SMK-1-domain-containing protein [Vararia minispora EC-137]